MFSSGDQGNEGVTTFRAEEGRDPDDLRRAMAEAAEKYQSEKRRNMLTAVGGALVGVVAFAVERSGAVSVSQGSMSLDEALANGRPTVVDFYTDWCENCKVMAPKMARIEAEYGRRVNFVAIDGDRPENDDLISTFGVDGIPHFAFIDSSGDVRTALIGLIPSEVCHPCL